MKLQNSNGAINLRRIGALKRLENQLISGFKPTLKPATGVNEALTAEDVERIKKEIAILKEKIISPESARALRTKKYRAAR